MYIGKYDHALDKKGRLVMPSRFRELFQEQFVEQFVLTKWLDESLRLSPLPEWKIFEKKLSNLPQTDAKVRYFMRLVFGSAVDVSLDRQGRIFVPTGLRAEVGIEKEVVVVGMNTVIEIWAKPRWETYHQKDGRPFEEIVQELGF